jgi:hypothetical protein
MKWEIDMQMKDGIIAHKLNDHSDYATLETIESRHKKVINTSIGEITVEFCTEHYERFVHDTTHITQTMKKNRRDIYRKIFALICLFVAVLFLTILTCKIWESLF